MLSKPGRWAFPRKDLAEAVDLVGAEAVLAGAALAARRRAVRAAARSGHGRNDRGVTAEGWLTTGASPANGNTSFGFGDGRASNVAGNLTGTLDTGVERFLSWTQRTAAGSDRRFRGCVTGGCSAGDTGQRGRVPVFRPRLRRRGGKTRRSWAARRAANCECVQQDVQQVVQDLFPQGQSSTRQNTASGQVASQSGQGLGFGWQANAGVNAGGTVSGAATEQNGVLLQRQQTLSQNFNAAGAGPGASQAGPNYGLGVQGVSQATQASGGNSQTTAQGQSTFTQAQLDQVFDSVISRPYGDPSAYITSTYNSALAPQVPQPVFGTSAGDPE